MDMKKIKNILRNERGLTLIELLAVVVILAIIAAIAIPAIGGLMDNTKKDAHVANAQQMVSSARLYLTGDKITAKEVTLKQLIDGGYMEDVEDPDTKATVLSGSGYDGEASKVTFKDGKVDAVTLISKGPKARNITGAKPNGLNRDAVKAKGETETETEPDSE